MSCWRRGGDLCGGGRRRRREGGACRRCRVEILDQSNLILLFRLNTRLRRLNKRRSSTLNKPLSRRSSSKILEAVVEDAAHKLVEHLEVAEARLDDGEQPVLVLGQEALRLGRVKRGKLLLELLLRRRRGVHVVLVHEHFDLDLLS